MTIHWFSDFVAGAIIGAAIGITVGTNFNERLPGGARWTSEIDKEEARRNGQRS